MHCIKHSWICWHKEIKFAAILYLTALRSGSPTSVPTEGKWLLPWNATHTRRLLHSSFCRELSCSRTPTRFFVASLRTRMQNTVQSKQRVQHACLAFPLQWCVHEGKIDPLHLPYRSFSARQTTMVITVHIYDVVWIMPNHLDLYRSIFTARKRSLRRLCFYRCVSVHRGGGGGYPSMPCRSHDQAAVYKQVHCWCVSVGVEAADR